MESFFAFIANFTGALEIFLTVSSPICLNSISAYYTCGYRQLSVSASLVPYLE